jgi:hypothetical protein
MMFPPSGVMFAPSGVMFLPSGVMLAPFGVVPLRVVRVMALILRLPLLHEPLLAPQGVVSPRYIPLQGS